MTEERWDIHDIGGVKFHFGHGCEMAQKYLKGLYDTPGRGGQQDFWDLARAAKRDSNGYNLRAAIGVNRGEFRITHLPSGGFRVTKR